MKLRFNKPGEGSLDKSPEKLVLAQQGADDQEGDKIHRGDDQDVQKNVGPGGQVGMNPKCFKKGWFDKKYGGPGDPENSKHPPELQVTFNAPLCF